MFYKNNILLKKVIKDSPISSLKKYLFLPKTNLLEPNYIQIESTTKCNMKCKQCMRTKEENYDMSKDLFKVIIDQVNYFRFGTNHIDLTGVGEPLLNPHLIHMIKYAKNKGFKVSFTSNFSLINKDKATELVDAKLDYMYISIDSATKELFEEIRGGSNFEETIFNVKQLINIKKEKKASKPLLNIYVTLSKENLNEIRKIIELAEDLRINRINFNRLIIPGVEYWKSELPIMSLLEEFHNKEVNIGRRAIPLKKYQPCVALKGCFITYDGKVLPCNRITQLIPRQEYPPYYLGDLNQNSLSDIWFSSRYKQFRNKLIMGLYPTFCKYCTHSHQF